jgi:hypothetical protein
LDVDRHDERRPARPNDAAVVPTDAVFDVVDLDAHGRTIHDRDDPVSAPTDLDPELVGGKAVDRDVGEGAAGVDSVAARAGAEGT